MSALAWLLVSLAGLHPAYLASLPLTPAVLIRELLLHGGAGVLWHALLAARPLSRRSLVTPVRHLSLQFLLTQLFGGNA